MPEDVQHARISQSLGRILFASEPNEDRAAIQRQLWTHSCDVVTVGLGEALWLWPLAGYDLVLVQAKKNPGIGIELCHRIKADDSTQCVVLLLGETNSNTSCRFGADAVLRGQPSNMQLLTILGMVLSRRLHSSEKKPVQRSGSLNRHSFRRADDAGSQAT